MSIQAGYVSQINVVETLTGPYVSGSDNTVTAAMNTTRTLNASSTPAAVSKYSIGRLTLTAGAGTLDLTSLPDLNGVAAAVTLNGLKPWLVKLRNLSSNANAITVVKGASNGYTGLGAAFSITLLPGTEMTFGEAGNAAFAAVSPTVKTLDVSGTGSQVLEFEIVAG